ncbi:glutamyl-tRNA amidotransferase [bacterium]|nr:glutamyl-tRNA amidotransferase [bacterium]|tara:strand:+ start:1968 stop:2435 length:468 start_codon:yes stop_codon:yes gene_type:complete
MTKEKIQQDLKEALKGDDTKRRDTLRLLLSAIQNEEIGKKGKEKDEELSEEEVIGVLQKEAKKRKESIEAYTKGDRPDLVEKEEEELKIIEKYLPEEMGEEEVAKIVDEAVQTVNPESMKDFGKVMGEVMKRTKGRADNSKVSKLVKEKLEKGEK